MVPKPENVNKPNSLTRCNKKTITQIRRTETSDAL